MKESGIGWTLTYMMEMRNVYRILVRKPEDKKPFGVPKSRWGVNTKWFLKA
jgi:hypothetical protein